MVGLLLFFNRRLPQLTDLSGGLGLGVAFISMAAISWSIYGLMQKFLLKRLSPQQILLMIYLGAIVLLWPASTLTAVRHASTLQIGMLAFSCLNTLVAYGAFAEALQHWDVSRIGAVLATTPLIAIGNTYLVEHFVPGLVPPEGLNSLSIFGAVLIAGGSAVSALASR